MPRTLFPATILLLFFTACNRESKPVTEQKKAITLRFMVDSAGAITDPATVQQLQHLARRISADGDKIMLHSYTESLGNKEAETTLANQQAQTAKQAMVDAGVPRMYYNVGIDVHGATNPLPGTQATDAQNRRIEIEFM